MSNEVSVTMESKSCNEAFARVVVAAFVSPIDPTVSEVTEIKTAVSEAVTNAIIHGYDGKNGQVVLRLRLIDGEGFDQLIAEVEDHGSGICDIEQARQPLFTTKPEMERSGMGFTIIQEFMDEVEIISTKGEGTRVIMTKKLINRGGAG